MKWCVVKTGTELFDLLHAYGLGILLAYGCGGPIEVRDTGCTYTLTSHISVSPSGPLALVDEILCLPTPQELESASLLEAGLSVANLDGLLTILFTTPGVRVLSVADLLKKTRRDDAIAERALVKVRGALTRWKKIVSKEPFAEAGNWLERVLQDYHPATPAIPVPADTRKGRDLSLVMTLDPSFSYSTHRPISDGFVSHKTQIAIQGTSFAILLATIGAARFLRAHRVGGDLVNCYVPQAERIILTRDSSLPLLVEAKLEGSQATLVQWLSYANHTIHTVHAQWTGLAYQTIQTQGMQQSIPRGQGCLNLTWLAEFAIWPREQLVSFWRIQLELPPERRVCEIDTLVDTLLNRSQSSWITHLLEIARCVHTKPDAIRPYRLEEVKEVIIHMQASIPSLLKKALEQKTGTLRFGHALRLLGDFNAAALRELVEELETVTTLDHLLRVLALTAQECQVAAAKTKFMVVPDDSDLACLLMDVEQSSPQTIARFLVLLSALRYPRLDENELKNEQLTRVIFLLITALTARPTGSAEDSNLFVETEQLPDQEMIAQESE
jgi:hypothetical protein